MTEKSKLQIALEQRERYKLTCDPGPLLGADTLPKVTIQIPRKEEEMKAIAMAHRDLDEIARVAGTGKERIKSDEDLLEELKLVNVLHFACRDAEDPKRPAFAHPLWMRENLDSDQLGSLLRLLEQARAARGPLESELSEERVMAYRQAVADAWDTPLPEQVLSRMDHPFLVSFCAYALKLWHDRDQDQVNDEDGDDDAQG